MPEVAGKRYWLVGASEGLGREIARQLDAAGAELVLSARNMDRLGELATELRAAKSVAMDVTDQESVSIAAQQLDSVDGLIYCAGAYEPVDAKDWQPDAVAQMAQVNFVGALNVLGVALPPMVARGSGHVVLIGSLSGFAGLPGAIGYGASKAGLMHLAENLRIDLKGTGITVQRMNPGFIRTRLTDKNDFKMPQLMGPDEAARHVVEAMKTDRFSTSFPRPFAWLFTVGRHLPLSWFQRIFA